MNLFYVFLSQNPVPSKEVWDSSPVQRLPYEIFCLVADQGVGWLAELKDFICSWQWHADLLLLIEDCFQTKHWGKLIKRRKSFEFSSIENLSKTFVNLGSCSVSEPESGRLSLARGIQGLVK